MEGEGNFLGMSGAPGDDAFEFEAVVGNRADLDQLGFDLFRWSHRQLQDATRFTAKSSDTGNE